MSYQKVTDEGEVEWIERPLDESDFFKTEKEKTKPKDFLKPQKKRLRIPELEVNTAYKIRVCAEGVRGRSSWTEIKERTFAEPDKDMGFTGPLHHNAPSVESSHYRWSQNK